MFQLFLSIKVEMKNQGWARSCRLCNRTKMTGNSYCSYHKRALSEIEARYTDWRTLPSKT